MTSRAFPREARSRRVVNRSRKSRVAGNTVIVTGSRTASRGRPRFTDANSTGFEAILFLPIRFTPSLRGKAVHADTLGVRADFLPPALGAQTRLHLALLPEPLPRRRIARDSPALFLQNLQASLGTGHLSVDDLHPFAAGRGFR